MRRAIGVLAWVLSLGALEAAQPGDGTSIVRDDWNYRESLAAIRDWEAVLAGGKEALGVDDDVPVLPVPSDGRDVLWPNPVPAKLIPPGETPDRVSLRLVEGRIEVSRTAADGQGSTRATDPGAVVVGYQHPGGGGKDRWYHAYHRHFDRLTQFRAKAAPFILRLTETPELGLGTTEIPAELESTSFEPVSLGVRWDLHSPRRRQALLEKTVRLAPGATARLELPVDLREEGGGVLVLRLACEGEAFWVPVLVHVEGVTAVCEGIGHILDDAPDPEAAALLSDLRGRAEELLAKGVDASRAAWRGLFEDASSLRDELLLRRIPFETLIFVKRKPYDSEQPFMDAHHLRNPPGGGIHRLSPVRPCGVVTPLVDSLGDGIYRDVCLHWNSGKLLFSFGNGSDHWDGGQSYDLYEIGVDGTGLRQLTEGPKNDCEPFYLPGGQIGFTSDRSEHFVMCGGDRHAPTLFTMEADGSGVRQLSFNVFNDFNPTVLPDGRILYSRWEYNERSVTSLHNPFTMNPDGSMVAPYYGNATIRPNVVMFPRPVPGTDLICGLFTAHHGQTHGSIGLIDLKRGIDGPDPITVLTPGIPITGEKAEDSTRGWYSDPVPLSDRTYLCSYTPTVVPWRERSWALYVGDRHGNLALVYRDPEISCAEPVPLISRPQPHVMPSAPPDTDASDATASLLVLDVRVGLPGVNPDEPRYLRILEDVPRRGVLDGGVICTSATSIYTVKRVLGTVPVESDGSAHFVVPANRNVYFSVLDGSQREIQRMRSVVCLKPGEQRSCIGCHESRAMSPPNRTARAALRPPSVPSPPPWGTATISYLRDIQPILNAKCVQCHTHDREKCGVILTEDLTDQFAISYEELVGYLRVANAMRWDLPEDVLPRVPYTYGSRVSPLMKLLDAGHEGVELAPEEWNAVASWVDANGVYYDRYETRDGNNRRVFVGSVEKTLQDVHSRRCASCHGDGDGRHDTWVRSLCFRDVASSRLLRAPLAKSAGGWQRCGDPVFADCEDRDYRRVLEALTGLQSSLARNPRADLASIRGTPMESQNVAIPEPPPPSPPETISLAEGWVALTDLRWESGTSGWSPNGDGLPRRDLDIEGRPFRVGRTRHRRGLGTHAPSEIVYRLERKYDRLAATVNAGEAGGTVVFQVFGDGKPLLETGVLRGPGGKRDLDISVEGVDRLRLVVTDAGDGYNSDVANWAGARLRGRP